MIANFPILVAPSNEVADTAPKSIAKTKPTAKETAAARAKANIEAPADASRFLNVPIIEAQYGMSRRLAISTITELVTAGVIVKFGKRGFIGKRGEIDAFLFGREASGPVARKPSR